MGEESSIAMNCAVGCRNGSDPMLLRLWCRPAAAALSGPLAWKPPCASGAALEKAKKKKKGWFIDLFPLFFNSYGVLTMFWTLLEKHEGGCP